VIFFLTFFFYIFSISSDYHNVRVDYIQNKKFANLFNVKINTIEFEDILSARIQPEGNKNVFFIESGDAKDVKINSRQACSIESAAAANPNQKIFIIFTSAERLQRLKRTPEVDAILSYQNVFINYLDLDEISVGTPFEKFFKMKMLRTSNYKTEHGSDVVRFLLLWKYGGTYLDTDIIVRKRLDTFPQNFACPESNSYMNNAAINLVRNEDSMLADIFAFDLLTNFNGTLWSYNGPMMMTRVLQKLCSTMSTTEMAQKKVCKGFHVIPKDMCYAIYGTQFSKLFDDADAEKTMELVKDSLLVHFWNKLSSKTVLRRNQKAAYIQLARMHCPKVFKIEKEFF
jgi:lactosylceramide 4-alpha-galactosyltransferase